jgi:hypothetical protein
MKNLNVLPKPSRSYAHNSYCYLITYKDSNRFWSESTYNSNNKELTYKNSNGVTRGFDIPEYTMEQLVEKLGNFKIKIKMEELKNSKIKYTQKLDCPYDFTSRCTMGSCDCKPKQETLEEAAEKEAAENKYGLSDQYWKDRIGFVHGAKWMQERMYSEEEVLADITEWFEQFKKK